MGDAATAGDAPGTTPSGEHGVGGDALLSRTTAMALRRLAHAQRDGWRPEGRLQVTARMVADDARYHGVLATRMVIALKRAWQTLDEAQRLHPHDALELLERLVALSIRAYYAVDAAPADPSDDAA